MAGVERWLERLLRPLAVGLMAMVLTALVTGGARSTEARPQPAGSTTTTLSPATAPVTEGTVHAAGDDHVPCDLMDRLGPPTPAGTNAGRVEVDCSQHR
jgi:hypothetical protein